MPSHFHWIIRTNNEVASCSDIMRDLKKYSAWDILDELENKADPATVNIFKQEAYNCPGQKRKFWQRRFYDVTIRSKLFMKQKIAYIHNNPPKANLVKKPQDYVFSSARNYLDGDNSIINIDMDWM